MITEQALARLLAQLGDTPDKVADTLTKAGAAGHRGSATRCPVACWLQQRGASYPLVSTTDVWTGDSGEADLPTHAVTPEPVTQFIAAFDDGHDYRRLDTDLAADVEAAS